MLLTADRPRHCFVAETLGRDLDLAGIVIEHKGPDLQNSDTVPLVVTSHLASRDAAEHRWFSASRWPDVPILPVDRGSLNTEDVAAFVATRDPELLLVYGTGLLKDPLMRRFDRRILNLHLGLSPYYRGAATNFWPLVNGEPECVGATVHLATADVDAGPILRQSRPAPSADPHDFGCAAIADGASLLATCARDFAAGRLKGVPQGGGGRVYRKRDFGMAAVEKLLANMRAGMLDQYAAEQTDRCRRFPIVT